MDSTVWLDHLLDQASPHQDATERQIMDAALELFLLYGLRRTTLGQIAKQAGVGRPTLYRRFADKDAVIQAVFMREARRQIHDIWLKVKDLESPEDALIEAFVSSIRAFNSHPLVSRLMATEPEVILPYLTVKATPFLNLLHSLLTDTARVLQQAGHFPGMDVAYLLEVLARLFGSLVVTPSELVDVNNEEKLQRFVEQCLAPLIHASKGE